MLSSVLASPKAVKVNIEIMRTFVRLRQILASNSELESKLEELRRTSEVRFEAVFKTLKQLISLPEVRRPRIGFHANRKN